MAKSNFIKSPAEAPAKPPAGYKGSSGKFDGAHKTPFGQYPRTKSPTGPPEKHYDTEGPFGQFPGKD